MPSSNPDEVLKRDLEFIDNWQKYGGMPSKFAKGEGIGVRQVFKHRALVEKRHPDKAHLLKTNNPPRPDPIAPDDQAFIVKKRSTLTDASGAVVLEWTKTEAPANAATDAIRRFVESLTQGITGLAPAIPEPVHCEDDLLALYALGDPHFGMYAWAAEAGNDFDLKEAERLTKGAIDRLAQSGPAASTALLLNIGDFFHADDSSNQTPASKNSLDVDTRFAHVVEIGFRSILHAVQRLLSRHRKVIVWIMRGNHDPHSAFWLAMCLKAYFDREPRVEINIEPSLYKYMRFGKVLIGAHHGHGAKMADLPGIMAADRREDWGLASYCYWWIGHIHHISKKETPGCIVESMRTLAPGDAWHHGQGYRAGRDMQLIVYSKQFGEIERHRCDAAMIPKTTEAGHER